MRRQTILLTMACLLAVSACTSDPGPRADSASYEVTECPNNVRGPIFDEAECGLLTVPAQRDGSSDTIKVFITRVLPASPTPGLEPVVVIPTIGGTPNYLGIAPMAQRTGREVIIVDGRGSGHSQPSLDCPEVTTSAKHALALSADDPTLRADYLMAVETCADRLRAQQTEPRAFTITETAADVADLRAELGIPSWIVASYGNSSRFIPELMRLDGDHVSAMILDSPELPGQDPISVAVDETPRLVAALLAECAENAACRANHPRAENLWTAARREVARTPIRLKAGALGEVLLDEALLLRIVRQVISDGGSSGLAFTHGSLPGILQDVVDRGGPWLDKEIAPLLASQDPFCLGYVSDCLEKMHLSAGVYLSVMCHDILPFAPPPEATSDPTFVRTFTSRADSEACARWNVGEAGDVGAPVDWDVPTLVFVGRFTPYTRVADVHRAVSGLPNGSVLVDPGGADNVLPRTECTLTLRTEWLDNPTGHVETPQCLRREHIPWNLN